MEQLHRETDKLEKDLEHLKAVLSGNAGDWQLDGGIDCDLALSIAKRVRRTSTLLVREIARERDKSQPGGTD